MRRFVWIGLFVVFLAALAVTVSSDDSSAEICDDVRIYILDPNAADDAPFEEKYVCSTVSGVQTVKDAVNDALKQQGRTMEMNLLQTQILSVDGVKAPADHYWRLFQWLPAGTAGWGLQAFNANSNEKMVSGTSYCLTISSLSNKDGTTVYSVPDFQPKSTGYVYFRFANGFAPDNEHVQKVFTPEIRAEGFWLEGYGSSMADVLVDAVERNWPGEIQLYSGNAGGQSLSGWIVTLFGLGDVNMGENVWAYWSQWTWQDHHWGYNDWTMGYYDPAVYHYLECIYLISTPDPYGDSYIIDKGGPEPDPEKEPITCLKNNLDVTFRLEDGTVVAQQTVKYGNTVDMSLVPEPGMPGMGFQGWGDTTAPVVRDAVFTAIFTPVTEGMKCVTYLAEDGSTLIWKDYVAPGDPATYTGIPVKASTKQYDFLFDCWSLDLSSVTDDLSVTPVFDSILRYYDVFYHDYDRSPVSTESTGYGHSAVRPVDPARESTVMYQYDFVGWSLTPNNFVPVDLDNITDTTYVFAYYVPVARTYTITFVEGDSVVAAYPIKYGTPVGGTYPLDLFGGTALAKMFRDAAHTKEYTTDYVAIGDTTVYVERIPGAYDSERDSSGNVVGTEITVTYSESLAGTLTPVSGKYVICDISQYSNGTWASLDRDSLLHLSSALGPDAEVTILVPRGGLTMKVCDLVQICDDNDGISFSVGNGPSSVKISSALKKINYSTFYRVNLKSGTQSVMQLPSGMTAEVSLRLNLSEGLPADVWNITSSGATTHLGCGYDGRYATFGTDLLQFYAVGTTGDVAVKETVICPYGEIVCNLDGSGMDGHATLVSMKIDNMGGVLFVPSSLQGCTLRTVSGGAFNSVTDASHLVIPCTVSNFSWNSWSNTGISDVYFLGDRPMFEGTVPAGVNVHYSPSCSGWNVSDGQDDLVFHTYNGSYRKDTFYFTYYLVDGKAVLYRYISGPYIAVPESIAAEGTSYPVEYIGDAAFMFTKDGSVMDLYDLAYSFYELETIELGDTVKEIHTRAFQGSTVKNVYLIDQVEHIWDEAFSGCGNLTNVKFSDILVFIGESAFSGCDGKAFTRVTVPDSVSMVGRGAFGNCSSITNVSLGRGLTEVPAYCFTDCVRLTEIGIPANVVFLGEGAFYNCVGLQYVDLNNVERVGEKAFFAESASVLEFIVFGENLKEIGAGAFANSSRLTEIEVHCSHFASFEAAFYNVDLDKVTLYASDDVMKSWNTYNVEPLEEKPEEDDGRLLLCVEIGLVVMFVIIGFVSLRMRTRSD